MTKTVQNYRDYNWSIPRLNGKLFHPYYEVVSEGLKENIFWNDWVWTMNIGSNQYYCQDWGKKILDKYHGKINGFKNNKEFLRNVKFSKSFFPNWATIYGWKEPLAFEINGLTLFYNHTNKGNNISLSDAQTEYIMFDNHRIIIKSCDMHDDLLFLGLMLSITAYIQSNYS